MGNIENVEDTQLARGDLLSDVVRCGAIQKRLPKDSTYSTALGSLLLGDVPQIATYHNKLKVFDILILNRRNQIISC